MSFPAFLSLALILIFNLYVLGYPQKNNLDDLAKTPANLTYPELVYILKFRHGMQDNPPKVMSPCARAILACCDDNKVMNEFCSETLLCGAFFFDDNPCEDKFIYDALTAAKIFYTQFNKVIPNEE